MRIGQVVYNNIPSWRYLKFGLISFGIELVVLNILMYVTSIYGGVWYAGFRATSYLIGHTFRFNFNKHFVFCSKESLRKEVKLYIVGISIGIVLGVAVSSLLVEGALLFLNLSGRWWANGAAFLGDAAAGFWDWKWNKHIVFPEECIEESKFHREPIQQIAQRN
jgi:putative flippase GtrA